MTAAAFTRNGRYLVSATHSPQSPPELRRVEVKTCELSPPFTDVKAKEVGISEDGQRLFTAAGDGALRVWDVSTSTQAGTLIGGGGQARFVVRHAGDGGPDVVFAAGDDGVVRQWRAPATPLARPFAGTHVASAGFDPAGRVVALGARGVLRADWRDPHAVIVRRHVNPLRAVLGPDARTVAIARGDSIDVVPAGPGAEIARFEEHGATSLAFRPDGRSLITAHRNQVAKLWRIADPDNGASFASAAFSPDGAVLATAGADGVRLWDAESGTALSTRSSRSFSSVRFSADGKLIVAAGPEAQVLPLPSVRQPVATAPRGGGRGGRPGAGRRRPAARECGRGRLLVPPPRPPPRKRPGPRPRCRRKVRATPACAGQAALPR